MKKALIQGETDLVLPSLMLQLIEDGNWPTSSNAQRQNLEPIYRNKQAYKDQFEMSTLFLYPPPFVLVSDDLICGDDFWKDSVLTQLFQKPLIDGIEPDQSLIIGGFGPGTDAIFILDYQLDNKKPRILGMDYGEVSNQKGWVLLAESINQFCELIGLP